MILTSSRKFRPLSPRLTAGSSARAAAGPGGRAAARPRGRLTRGRASRLGLLLVAVLATPALVAEPQLVTNDPLARETFFDRKEEGWFWYRDAAEEEWLPPPPPPPPQPATARASIIRNARRIRAMRPCALMLRM